MEIRRGGRRQIRDWALAFGPQDLANRRGEAAVLVLICLVALVLVALADIAGRGHGSVAAIGSIPVMAAGWFLGARLTALVAAVAIGLRLLVASFGLVEPITGAAQAVTIPVLAYLSHAAAVGLLNSHRQADRARRLEESREKASELERAKAEFLRLASHELRSPVAVLGGYISMLQDGQLGRLPGPAADVLPILDGKVRAVNQLIEQMLEAARLEDSRLQLQPRSTELRTLVPPIVEGVRPLLSEEHSLRLDGPLPEARLLVDGRRIGTILNNLLENAIKYSPEGGEITVSARVRKDNVEIRVSDQGLGIPKEGLERLFTRFGRIVTPATSHIPGTGLGLYLSREIARMHGGDLRAESEEGKGSTFTLLLPEERAAPQELRVA